MFSLLPDIIPDVKHILLKEKNKKKKQKKKKTKNKKKKKKKKHDRWGGGGGIDILLWKDIRKLFKATVKIDKNDNVLYKKFIHTKTHHSVI